MPKIKSAKKRVGLAAKRQQINVAERSKLRNALKKTTSSLTAKDTAQAPANLKAAVKTLDSAATKGIIHKNQAARRKSRLTKKLNTLLAGKSKKA